MANTSGQGAYVGGNSSEQWVLTQNDPQPGWNTLTGNKGGLIVIPADDAYKLDFVIADWVVGATNSTITILASTHLKGINPIVQVYEGVNMSMVNSLTNSATGDITLEVPNGFTFDGKVLVAR